MVSVLPLLVVLTAGADSTPANRPIEAPTRLAVKVLAFAGAGMITAGLGLEFTGRAGSDPRAPVPEWSKDAAFYSVGGIALMGAGLCVVTIAALLTPWHFPSLAFSFSPSSASVAVAVRWP